MEWVSSVVPELVVYQVKINLLLFFLQVKNWVKELRKMLGNEICLCIVGKSVFFNMRC